MVGMPCLGELIKLLYCIVLASARTTLYYTHKGLAITYREEGWCNGGYAMFGFCSEPVFPISPQLHIFDTVYMIKYIMYLRTVGLMIPNIGLVF